MRLTNYGLLGVGTSAPAHTLDVNGTANVSGTLTAGPGATGTPFAMAKIMPTCNSSNDFSGYIMLNHTANVTGVTYNSSGYVSMAVALGTSNDNDFNMIGSVDYDRCNMLCSNGSPGWTGGHDFVDMHLIDVNHVTIDGDAINDQCQISIVIFKF
jgi:hypothetical protein